MFRRQCGQKKISLNQIELFDETIRNLDDWDFNFKNDISKA
jgi:hypothetical protein